MEKRTIFKTALFYFTLSLIALFISEAIASVPSATNAPEIWQYSWVQWDENFDCIVGITVRGDPVSTGVIVGGHHVLTSANPLETATDASIKIHAIDSKVNQSQIFSVLKLERETSLRKRYWVPVGEDKRHSPIHDLMVIHLTKLLPVYSGGYRQPTLANLNISKIKFESSEVFTFAGFGFVDKLHVKQNFELEPVYYTVGNVLEDCDEWIPRSWGRFICIRNDENFVGVSSGSGLFYTDKLVGIGSFAVSKGNESILLFTDIRQYWHSLWGNVYSFLELWDPTGKPPSTIVTH